ncbi:MAG: ATP-grasp domain-containing protein [Candidatus Bathyarchaeota archaeon]|nr:MAG: ATP-grasp domain-containing protein [Candidatus Bathyarchaeota archaeon]
MRSPTQELHPYRNVLAIGIDAVALSASARDADYNTYAVDYFGDVDLKQTCKNMLSIVKQEVGKSYGRFEAGFSPRLLLNLVKRLLSTHQVDAALLASGLEDSPRVLAELHKLVPIVGNSPEIIKRVRNNQEFFNGLDQLSISHPITVLVGTYQEAKQAAKDIGYPVIAKPIVTFGGVGIRKINDGKELRSVFHQNAASPCSGVLIQDFIFGVNASVSFLSSSRSVTMLTLNEQLLGMKPLGQEEPFGYCGNIVPLSIDNGLIIECSNLVQKIASYFNLLGINGVDLVISNDGEPYVIEVNPRFQGTLECVERVLGLNLVDAHIKTCTRNILPILKCRKPMSHCARMLLFARFASIAPNLSNIKEARNIPLPGVFIEEGEPLCSIMIEGKTREAVLKKALKLSSHIYGMTRPTFQ